MPKELKFESEAQKALLSGIDKLTDAVQTTMGPQGRTVMIQINNPVPLVTKDGVSVAKSISLEDPYENMGAQMAKDVASKTADLAGDGTTTATVLARAIAHEFHKNVIAGANPIEMKSGADMAVEDLTYCLESIKSDLQGSEDIKKIATISGNNDSSIGDIIAEAMEATGDDGIITIESSPTAETYLDTVEGMEYDRGYVSPHFVTNEDKSLVEFEKPYILLYHGKISSANEVIKPIEFARKDNRPLLIIAEEIEEEAITTLLLNKIKGGLKIAAIKSPGFGESIGPILEDIAIQTKGYCISSKLGHKLDDIQGPQAFGSADKIIISSETTTIINGHGDDDKIESRAENLKSQLGFFESKFETERIKDRIAKLTGGICVIRVGGQTDAERQERKDRFDDALSATKAAVLEGIVAGGGTALVRASNVCKANADLDDYPNKKIGYMAICDAVTQPLKQIAINAGQVPEVVLKNVMDGEGSFGYDAKENKYKDMIDAGIIDPVKVTKSALKNASSIANLILTTNCLIVEKPKG